MDTTRIESLEKLLTLREAAQQLSVPVETLLKWNDFHILTPKITLTGEIGYTQAQINQFLTIQHTLQVGDIPLGASIHTIQTPTQQAHLRPHGNAKLFLSALGLFSVAFFLVLFTQQEKLMAWLSLAQNSYQKASSQTKNDASTANLPQQIAMNQQDSQNGTENSLHGTPESTFSKNIFAPTISNQKRQVLATSVSSLVTSQQQKAAAVTPRPGLVGTTNDTTTLASRGKASVQAQQEANTDTTGVHIPGKSNTLAMVLGAGSTVNASQQGTVDTKNQLIFLVGSAMIVGMLLLRKQRITPALAVTSSLPIQKILEVNQKMDGTVVLSFQGKDYKISKPELDSDSDKFIERLLGLMQPHMKEMEYESLTDTIQLSTPLSRIVTRLGFVGIKRDLFFPRTSKHRVLFRKYVTAEDLAAMNLTTTQIQNDLSQIS